MFARACLGSLAVASCLGLAACGGSSPNGGPTISFGEAGPIAGAAGQGSFTFGVATAAMQIEEDQPASDWYYWSLPVAQGGMGKGTPIGDSVRGREYALNDLSLVTGMHLDAYRFNMSWPRIQPTKDGPYDQTALAHYDAVIDALVAAHVKPVVTVHHFSSPIWVDDFRDTDPMTGCVPSATDLCGWDNDAGAAMIIQEMAAYAGMLAARYGDRVDEWGTLNEPVNYMVASYGAGQFPPGKFFALGDGQGLLRALRNYIKAHVAMYDAIKANDTVDADGDGQASLVGLSLNHLAWTAAADGQFTSDPTDLAAEAAIKRAYHHLFVDAALTGGIDTNLDGTPDETIPGVSAATPKLDWLGVQYYARLGVTGQYSLNQLFNFQPCLLPLLPYACVAPADPTHCVPEMEYEYYEAGVYEVLTEYHASYPNLPLTVTESGLAAENGRRRAEHIVRSLEQIVRARDEGVDVRGYYHWSLMDNFEWSYGYEPHFGLFRVDRSQPAYPRIETEGATVLRAIAGRRRITSAQRGLYGGTGPMTPETLSDPTKFDLVSCTRAP